MGVSVDRDVGVISDLLPNLRHNPDSVGAGDLETFINRGQDVEERYSNGESILMKAADLGRLDLVTRLLQEPEVDGCAKNAQHGGFTPLHYAAERGHKPVVEVLLRHWKDNINQRYQGLSYIDDATTEGFTPLMIASREGHVKVVRELLQWGPDTNAQSKEGITALMLATHNPDHGRKVLQLLLAQEGIDKQAQDNRGGLVLEYAAQTGDPGILETVLSDDELAFNRVGMGPSPLYWYVQGILENLRYFRGGRTVDMLFERPDINSAWVAGEGRQILLLLAELVKGKWELDALLPDLLNPGRADAVEWDEKDDDYPLVIAVMAGNMDFIPIYLHHRKIQAEFCTRTDNWLSTLSQALSPFTRQTLSGEPKHEGFANQAPEIHVKGGESFHEPTADEMQVALCAIYILAVAGDGPETFEKLSSRTNFDLNRTDHNNPTLLWHSSDKSYVTTTRKLLELGVKLHTRGTEGDTPLKRCSKDILRRSRNKEVFDLMVNHMAQSKSRYDILMWGLETDHENLC
ncbi:hypothetical protein PG988_015386 [Apiospora saccharicola]